MISCRKVQGITQAQLAKTTGINRSVLSGIENGTHTPSIEQLEKLAGALEFDIVALFTEAMFIVNTRQPMYWMLILMASVTPRLKRNAEEAEETDEGP